MLNKVERLAPAKINLSFRILRKREDGFHEVETLMAPIALADRLSVGRSTGDEINLRCSDPTLPTGEDNLVVKAARAFFARTGESRGLEIDLEKKVPHGAGLGGGSSDAAGVLLALNELFAAGLSLEALSEIAATFGSDIPFFLYEKAALCKGRGEQVEPVDFPHEVPLLLLKPPFGVPTPWAYSRWKDSREIPGVLYTPQAMPWGEMVNDLERPVFEKHTVLADMKMWLLEQPKVTAALMSGSGSTMLAFLRDSGADGLKELARKRFGDSLFLCETSVTVANTR